MKLPAHIKVTPERALYTIIASPDGKIVQRWAHGLVCRVEIVGPIRTTVEVTEIEPMQQ